MRAKLGERDRERARGNGPHEICIVKTNRVPCACAFIIFRHALTLPALRAPRPHPWLARPASFWAPHPPP